MKIKCGLWFHYLFIQLHKTGHKFWRCLGTLLCLRSIFPRLKPLRNRSSIVFHAFLKETPMLPRTLLFSKLHLLQWHDATSLRRFLYTEKSQRQRVRQNVLGRLFMDGEHSPEAHFPSGTWRRRVSS